MPRDGVEGAAPPFIVHTDQVEAKKSSDSGSKTNMSKDDVVKLSSRFVEGLQNPHAGPDAFFNEVNPFGFTVRSTKSRSMTQEICYDWCIHFVKHLPKKQGKGELYTSCSWMATLHVRTLRVYNT